MVRSLKLIAAEHRQADDLFTVHYLVIRCRRVIRVRKVDIFAIVPLEHRKKKRLANVLLVPGVRYFPAVAVCRPSSSELRPR